MFSFGSGGGKSKESGKPSDGKPSDCLKQGLTGRALETCITNKDFKPEGKSNGGGNGGGDRQNGRSDSRGNFDRK